METKTTDICCPKFDPVPWENKTLVWDNKQFIKESIPTFLHIPLPNTIAKVMTKLWSKAQATQALPDIKDVLILAYDPSLWKSEYHLTVTKEVPGAQNLKLSGTFISKVFEGPYSGVPKWMKEMDKFLASQGKKSLKTYIYYTTCPKCAKLYGKNYVVLFAQVA